MNLNKFRTPKGFTLIELMIVVAIIGILAAIAYPNYVTHVRKAKRVDAKSLLLQAANREESLYTVNYKYTSDFASSGLNLSTTTDNKAYTLSGTVSSDNQHFTLTATAATPDQSKDSCYTMTVTDTGLKTAKNAGGADTTSTCW